MLNVHRIITGELEENCYILNIDDNALIIDPGDEGDKIIKYVNSKKYNVLGILITHHHFDHVGALDEVKKEYKKAKVIDYKNKGNIDLGPFSFRIINTYGHTLDSVSYYFEKDNKIFTGDFIFKGTIGNFDDENMYTMFESIDGFKNLDSSIKIYPGHGDDTTVGYELETNPFLRGF